MPSKKEAARVAKIATALRQDAVVEAVEATFGALDEVAETGAVSVGSHKRLSRALERAVIAVDAPRRPVRTASIPLTLADYPANIAATMRINPPMREYEALSTDTRGTLRRLILDWNLPDENGEVVLLDATLSGATDEELAAFLQGWYQAVKERTVIPK